ncbi:hypothetical protein JXI42_04510, partial [bacterium]|nr:hypothetical protein [bacterium]
MNNKIVFFFLFVIFLFVVNNLSALTYFRLLVDGEETDTLIQGVDYYFQADCEPWDTVFFVIYEDFNDNGIIDGHEWSIWEGYDEIPTLIDNYEHPPEERGIFIDDIDPDLGELLFDVDLYWWVGDFIFKVWEGADTLVIPFHIAAPESLTMSVTGHVVIEGITPPNPAYFDILFWGGLFGPPEPIFMLFNTDSMGTFSFNWVGEPETIIIGFLDHDPPFESLGYRVEELFYYVYVDTHVTDVELYIPRFVPDTCTFHGYIATSEGEPVTCDSLFMVYYLDRYIPMPDDTFYVDADSGYFELRISMEMYEMIELGYKYYKIPTYLMTHSEFGMGSFYFNASDEIHDFEYTDTLFVKNDSFWVSYVYDYHTTPVMIDLPVKASNNRYGCTIVTVPYGSIVPFWICDNHLDTFWGTWYELTLASDDVLPPNYAFYNGGRYSVKVGDSVEIIIGEMRSFISGTLFSATGEIITDSTKFVLHQYSGSGGYLWYGYEIPIINGIYENTPLFSDTLYWFESDTFAGYMRPINDCRSFVPGYHTANFTLYPTDTFFSLYLEIDSSDPRDDVFQVELYSPEDDAMHSKRIPKNRWVSFPIYSGFSEPCRLLIKNLSLYGASPLPLTRLVENNGNIPVEAGDSILINMEAPIDYFIMEFVEDPADAWQHSLSPASLTICYYSREDTHIVYSYVPNDDCGMSLELPIFSEPMLVKPESPFWFDLHYFIANPDEYLIVGGAYRPDHVTRYFNKGTGEMLLSLDGYPADYLGDDTIFFPRGDFSGIETPEHPEHHYIADLFLFRTDMFHHPYGDGSVMAFHDVCDGEWTVVLPESLPGGFVPAVTETTFYVEDMSIYPDEWQEFPIAIPVKSPAGVHGYVNRELRFFEANLIQADFYVQGTDSLAATTRAWQYYPWGPPSILAKYYKRNTELPPNEYYLQLSFTGWTAEEPIIYPEQIEFSYTGDSLLLPDSYIAMTR